MKANKTMLLGIIIALSGLGMAQPGNQALIFRTYTFLPPETIEVFFPFASIILILVGVIVGLIGFFRKE